MSKDQEQLIEQYIALDPGHLGVDRARLKDYGVHVWALIADLRQMLGEQALWAFVNGEYRGDPELVRQLADDFRVPVEAVWAALAYYQKFQQYIDSRLMVNSAPLA